MDKNNDTPSNSESFWKTLPGILTALITLITAIIGLVASLNQIGVFDQFNKPDAQHIGGEQESKNTPETGQRPRAPATGLNATADDITYTVLSGHREI